MKSSSDSLIENYDKRVLDGALEKDTAQRSVALELDGLARTFIQNNEKKNTFNGFFTRGKKPPKGLYIWGDVGRGKTMLMDMFFEGVKIKAKRRVHFHAFMDHLHKEIAVFRKKDLAQKKGVDPIAAAVANFVQDTKLLCFDEFHVTDITNAMLLGRLFEKLFEAGIVVVATSNVVPDKLYHNGLNRQLFLPFIELLKEHCKTVNLQAQKDYRLDKLTQQPVFHFGIGNDVKVKMDEYWHFLTAGENESSGRIRVLGRDIVVPRESFGSARFNFADLCEKPLGTRDYLAISRAFHTLMIDGVPQFCRDNSNGAKRFIQLIDTLYDRGVKLVASFEVGLDELSGDKDTVFEFKRTVSRLNEMASLEYLSQAISEV